MPPHAAAVVARPDITHLRRLPGLRLRPLAPAAPARIRTGLTAFDRLSGGGLPRGAVTEILGASCSGRTALAYAAVAATTADGELAAYIDLPDAFDPEHAHTAGVELARVLWIRPRDLRAMLQAAEHVLHTGGFAIVVMDVARSGARDTAVGAGAWLRLVRAAARHASAAVVLGERSLAGTFATLRFETERESSGFVGVGPRPSFDGFLSTIHLRKNRLTPAPASAVRLRAAAE